MSEETTQWGIVELMGHKVVAGRISKEEMYGKPMLRVDVPPTEVFGEFTQLYGESAIYCVTFTSAEVARRAAEQCHVSPISVYVPDLVTKEQLEAVQAQYRAQIDALRRQLPAGDPRLEQDEEPEEF